MNTSALIMMLATEAVVVFFTAYFFIKVLRNQGAPKEEIDEVQE